MFQLVIQDIMVLILLLLINLVIILHTVFIWLVFNINFHTTFREMDKYFWIIRKNNI